MHDSATNTPRAGRSGLFQYAPVILAVLLVAVYYGLAGRSEPPPGWGSDYAAALNTAAESGSHVVVAFYSEGCPPCAAMDRWVLGEPSVQAALADYVPVRLNAFAEQALVNELGVQGTPTFAVVDPQGRVIARCEGFQPKEQFIAFLAQAKRPDRN